MAILLSHPHAAAVANATAIALDRHRMLAAYFTGIAGVAGHRSGRLLELLARRAPVAHNRLLDGLDPAKLRSLPLTELAARAVGRTLERALGARVTPGEALFLAHDARVAAAHWPATTRAVYAYEDGARRTFHRAAKRGLARIWDLPAVHYATVETLWREEAARWPGAMGAHPRLEPPWKRRLKDDELALATHIFVASSFTRASVARVASVPITVAPYGFPTASFPARSAAPRGPFTVLAVGTQDLRKGTPYLLEAWKRAAIKDARLKIIGSMNLSPLFSHAIATTSSTFPPSHAPSSPPNTAPPTSWSSPRSATASASSCKKPCAAARRSSRPDAAEAPNASPMVSTAGSSRSATSTRSSTASASPPATATQPSRWAYAPGPAPSATRGPKPATRSAPPSPPFSGERHERATTTSPPPAYSPKINAAFNPIQGVVSPEPPPDP